MPSWEASTLTPPNIVASRITITVNTRRALRHSVGLNAMTLSLIASIPVRAAQPELKARIKIRPPAPAPPTVSRSGPWTSLSTWFCWAAASPVISPWASLTRPTTTRVSTAAMNT